MKQIEKYLDIRWDKHKKKWDTVIAIVGDVGSGKSTLAMWMMEYWQRMKNGKVTPEDIKHMCMTKQMFMKDLSDSKPMECTVYDEAGELTSRRAMSEFNTRLMTTYKIIRADRLFTILVIDNIWDLDSYFRNNRLKALFYVCSRGRVKVYLKKKLRYMMALNQNKTVRSYNVIKPSFYDTFRDYDGILAKVYEEIKTQKTEETRKNLKEQLEKKQSPRVSQAQLAKSLGIPPQTLNNWIVSWRERKERILG